jgi:hypothetical protein
MRLCGPPIRSVGPTIRSVSLQVGQTHLSGMAVSLVGGDPGGTDVSEALPLLRRCDAFAFLLYFLIVF